MGGWGRRWSPATRPERPKARRIAKDEQSALLATMVRKIGESPVLSSLMVTVRAARGRFYLSRPAGTMDEPMGRITPLDGGKTLLLEQQGRREQWFHVAEGSPGKLINRVAGDELGRFHGLGSLDKRLRETGSTARLPLQFEGSSGDEQAAIRNPRFWFEATGEVCTAQESLYHDFGIPIAVLVEPREWYQCHRQPVIAEFRRDRTRVLVKFIADRFSGPIVGTCLYALRQDLPGTSESAVSAEGGWGAYTVRPNVSDNIAAAEAWLVKRKWQAW